MQLSTGWGARHGGGLGRARWTELRLNPPAPKSKRAREAGPVPSHQRRCPHAGEGGFVDGPRQGTVTTVGTEPKCAVHGTNRPHQMSPEERAAAEQQGREQREAAHREALVRERLLRGVIGRVPHPLTKAELGLIVAAHLSRMSRGPRRSIAARHQLAARQDDAPKTDSVPAKWLATCDGIEPGRLLVGLALWPELAASGTLSEASPWHRAARRWEPDPDRIATEVAAECDRKARQRAERQRKPKAAAKKSTKKARAAH